jgi:hypothetical protein
MSLQINVTLSPEEDRLLMRASSGNGQEFRLWLTRRFTALLMKVISEQLDKMGGVQQVAALKSTTEQLRNGAFDKPYQPETKIETDLGNQSLPLEYPLGKKGVIGYTINVTPHTNDELTLQLLPKEGQGLNIIANASMLYMIYNLLEQTVYQAEWELSTHKRQNMH